jgi:hypothetical protein
MTTQKLLEIVRNRGLDIVLKDGRPVIVPGKHRHQVTDKLLAVLRFHRERIIALLGGRNVTRQPDEES